MAQEPRAPIPDALARPSELSGRLLQNLDQTIRAGEISGTCRLALRQNNPADPEFAEVVEEVARV